MVVSREITNWLPEYPPSLDAAKELPEPEVVDVSCTHEIRFEDAVNVQHLQPESVDLVVTSPPYWSIKDYGRPGQLGFGDDLDVYIDKLAIILGYCIRALKPKSRLCVNIGDQFLRASTPPKKVYEIVPLHAYLINRLLVEWKDDLVYQGSIFWAKVTKSQTSGGGQIMGSYPYPKQGYFFVNREFIAIFGKGGKVRKEQRPPPLLKEASRLSLEEWQTFFKDTWNFRHAPQDSHRAVFPDELPERLIKMYSFVGDTILDPFLGSGTTVRVAALLGRSSLGYEIGFDTVDGSDWQELIQAKVEVGDQKIPFEIQEKTDGVKNTRPALLRVHNIFKYS